MSKRAEEAALKTYPAHDGASKQWIKMHLSGTCADYIKGYEQAEKDTIERVVKWLEENGIGYNYSESSFDSGEPAEMINDLRKAMGEYL